MSIQLGGPAGHAPPAAVIILLRTGTQVRLWPEGRTACLVQFDKEPPLSLSAASFADILWGEYEQEFYAAAASEAPGPARNPVHARLRARVAVLGVVHTRSEGQPLTAALESERVLRARVRQEARSHKKLGSGRARGAARP